MDFKFLENISALFLDSRLLNSRSLSELCISFKHLNLHLYLFMCSTLFKLFSCVVVIFSQLKDSVGVNHGSVVHETLHAFLDFQVFKY